MEINLENTSLGFRGVADTVAGSTLGKSRNTFY